MVEYFIVESLNGTKSDDTLTSADGFGTFAISFPHQGQVSKNFFCIVLGEKLLVDITIISKTSDEILKQSKQWRLHFIRLQMSYF